MNAKVDGRSARGRPRFGWMDGVKRALNDRRMDMGEASEHARNTLILYYYQTQTFTSMEYNNYTIVGKRVNSL